MPTAMTMDLQTAVETIGNYFVSLCDTDEDGAFGGADFPIPDFLQIEAGRPYLTVRWDGITEWDMDYSEVANSPSGMRWEIRIYHSLYLPAGEDPEADAYKYAQTKVLSGSSAFFQALMSDVSLNDLVIDITINGSISGELFDPRANETFYGHEIILTTNSY